MIVIAKTITENNKVIAQWEFDGYCDTWGNFIRSVKTSGMITDYYDFVEVNNNGILIFKAKYNDEEHGILTRTYQLKY